MLETCLKRSAKIKQTSRMVRDEGCETMKRIDEWNETEGNAEEGINGFGITTTETQIPRDRGDDNVQMNLFKISE